MVDVLWIGIAFALGLVSRQFGLPPLAGYLVAGFVLYAMGVSPGGTLDRFAELGITLLLFTIGLKLHIRGLARPQIWGVATLHLLVVASLLGAVLLALAVADTGVVLLEGLGWQECLLVGFALSFSSTVFAVKVLEERSDLSSVYGRTMIGILIMQDIAAVVFLAISTGKSPTLWAVLLLLGLLPLRWLLFRLLDRAGHGELLILFGLSVALGGAHLFDLVQIKGDLGALVLGAMLAGHRSANELAKGLLSLKDLFLVGFFLSIGLEGIPGVGAFAVACLLVAMVPLKGALFFWLLTRFRMRASTSMLTALGLSNYSEFGLIVAALATERGWLPVEWLTTLAVVLALSFLFAAPLNARSLAIYERYRERLARFEQPQRLPEEAQIDPGPARVLIFGMGRVGTGAYDRMVAEIEGRVVGIDSSPEVVERHTEAGRDVILASGTDQDFWERLHLDTDAIRYVLLTMPRVEENAYAAGQVKKYGFRGQISALAKYQDDIPLLRAAGANHVFNLYSEAGSGLAEDAIRDAILERR